MSSKDLYSIIHYHHSMVQFIWPQTSISTDRASNPTLPKDIFQTKQLHHPYDKPTCLLCSLFPSQHTHISKMEENGYLSFPRQQPWHHLWLFPFTFTETTHSDLQKSLVYLSLFLWSLLMLSLTLNQISRRVSPRWSPFFQVPSYSIVL